MLVSRYRLPRLNGLNVGKLGTLAGDFGTSVRDATVLHLAGLGFRGFFFQGCVVCCVNVLVRRTRENLVK
jgi:hypothetical protein